MPIDDLPSIGEVIRRDDLRARKSLGQNFLLDLNLTSRIARAVPFHDDPVVEIGPGPGALTRALLATGVRKLICVEMDERFLPALNEISAHYPNRLDIVSGDARTVPLAELTQGPFHIAANLPYNVGTHLLTGWLEADWPPSWKSLTLMFQKEVAERLIARPNQKQYGRLSVLTQWRNHADILFDVSASAFVPPPKVTSSIVQIMPKSPHRDVKPSLLGDITRRAFAQRRKMLRVSLKQLCSQPEDLLAKAGIDGQRRGETLSVDEFCHLAAIAESLGIGDDPPLTPRQHRI